VADEERAHAYLELGRAYEKDDQLDRAKEGYTEATRRAPQEAAAFLRLGVLYGEQQDYASAAEAFTQAESLYQLLSNHEGVVEVLYQRGRFLSNRGLLAEARMQLEKALNQALTLDNKHQQIRALLELSRVAYTNGEMTLAQQYATRAIDLAQ